MELFARFPRLGWSQWGNEDVDENHANGVALRKGHVEPNLRLVEPPRNYRGEQKPAMPPAIPREPSFEEIALRRVS